MPGFLALCPDASLTVDGGSLKEDRQGRKGANRKAVAAGESNSLSFSNLSSGHLSEEPAGEKNDKKIRSNLSPSNRVEQATVAVWF